MADSRAGAGIIQDQSGPFNEAKSKELWGGEKPHQTNKDKQKEKDERMYKGHQEPIPVAKAGTIRATEVWDYDIK